MAKVFIRHGACRGGLTPEYQAWERMHRRCRHAPDYKGVEVCERWRTFPPFLEDMGELPSPKHTLERRKNSLGYSPDNCRWATKSEQARNRSTNLLIAYRGRLMPLAEACELAGINYDAAKYRVYVGKPFNKALRRTAQDYRG